MERSPHSEIPRLEAEKSPAGISPSQIELITEVIFGEMESDDRFSQLVQLLPIVFHSSGGLIFLETDGYGEIYIQTSDQPQARRIFIKKPDWDRGLLEGCLLKQQPLTKTGSELKEPGVLPAFLSSQNPDLISCAAVYYSDHSYGALAIWDPDQTTPNLTTLQAIGKTLGYKIYSDRKIQELKVTNARLEVNRWQLMNSRNTLRALFDSIPISMYIIDRKFNLVAINMERSRRTSQPPNKLVGQRCHQALFNLDDPCPDCRVIDTLLAGETITRTKREWQSELDPLEWEITSYPIEDDSQIVLQAILLEEDVTEKRRLEATLAQSEKLAAVGQLAAGLAHEINNPLTAVIANAQLIRRDLPQDNEDTLEMIDLILQAGERASQVVRNLLDLARRENLDFAPVDINETVHKALALLGHEFLSHGVELVLDAGSDLPFITASQDHLQSVWINLLTNAMDALETQPGRISVTTRLQGNEVQVIIADNGKGISDQTLAHIFEPFYTTKEPGRGTGLGLSVCHRIIKQHGGRILVDSQLEIGTQFTVILPAK